MSEMSEKRKKKKKKEKRRRKKEKWGRGTGREDRFELSQQNPFGVSIQGLRLFIPYPPDTPSTWSHPSPPVTPSVPTAVSRSGRSCSWLLSESSRRTGDKPCFLTTLPGCEQARRSIRPACVRRPGLSGHRCRSSICRPLSSAPMGLLWDSRCETSPHHHPSDSVLHIVLLRWYMLPFYEAEHLHQPERRGRKAREGSDSNGARAKANKRGMVDIDQDRGSNDSSSRPTTRSETTCAGSNSK